MGGEAFRAVVDEIGISHLVFLRSLVIRLLVLFFVFLLSSFAFSSGDGFNPSYAISRALAKPHLNVSVRRKGGQDPLPLRLPRAKVLVLGGDLAYPNPNEETYETRFFRTFQCALPPPLNYDPQALSMHKPPLPGGVAGLKEYKGPTCFAIPGNRQSERRLRRERERKRGK